MIVVALRCFNVGTTKPWPRHLPKICDYSHFYCIWCNVLLADTILLNSKIASDRSCHDGWISILNPQDVCVNERLFDKYRRMQSHRIRCFVSFSCLNNVRAGNRHFQEKSKQIFEFTNDCALNEECACLESKCLIQCSSFLRLFWLIVRGLTKTNNPMTQWINK